MQSLMRGFVLIRVQKMFFTIFCKALRQKCVAILSWNGQSVTEEYSQYRWKMEIFFMKSIVRLCDVNCLLLLKTNTKRIW